MSTPRGTPTLASAGWIVVAIGFLALSLSFSARSALGLVMPVWEDAFGWPRSFVSLGGAITLTVMAGVAPLAGGFIDRHGPRSLLAAGMALTAIGLLVVAGMESRWMFLAGFAGVAALGFGMVATHTVATAVAQLFDRGRGLAIGIATAGSTAGQLLVVPLLALIMEQGSWRGGFVAIAIGCAAIAVTTLIVLRRQSGETVTAARSAPSAPLRQRLGFLLRHRVFQALFWSFTICGFTTSGVIETHLLPYAAACGFPPLPSAAAYGVLSAVNLLGMIGAGYLCDRVNRPALLAAIYAGRALSFVLLLFVTQDIELLFVFAVVFGVVDYSTIPATAGLAASHLGLNRMGLAMGLIAAGHALGGAAGAFLAGWLYDLFAQYAWVWIASIALAAIAAALVLVIPERREADAALAAQPA